MARKLLEPRLLSSRGNDDDYDDNTNSQKTHCYYKKSILLDKHPQRAQSSGKGWYSYKKNVRWWVIGLPKITGASISAWPVRDLKARFSPQWSHMNKEKSSLTFCDRSKGKVSPQWSHMNKEKSSLTFCDRSKGKVSPQWSHMNKEKSSLTFCDRSKGKVSPQWSHMNKEKSSLTFCDRSKGKVQSPMISHEQREVKSHILWQI